MTVWLDGRQMQNRADAHAYLAQVLRFPGWYGRNLDALYDLLTAGIGVATLKIIHADAMLAGMGDYGERMLRTIRDASESGGPALIVED